MARLQAGFLFDVYYILKYKYDYLICMYYMNLYDLQIYTVKLYNFDELLLLK